ncbi:ISAs1 family transposase, partial [Mesorhizobium sp. M00.F.Ca.ET.216.01.1.1]
IACNPKVAAAIIDAGADYLLAVKANQPGLMGEIERFFDDPQCLAADRCEETDKGHGRIEERRVAISTQVDWLAGERRFPGEYRLP